MMTFLVDFGIKSVLALAIAFLIAWLMRRSPASLRYALWSCSLAATLALPLICWTIPSWKIERSAPQIVPQSPSSMSVVVHAHRPAPAPQSPRKMPPERILITIWLAGALAMLARTGAGHWRVRSLFGKAEIIRDPRWLALTEETAATIQFRRPVRLKTIAATDVPLSYGLIRATVLLPAEAAYWSEDRARVVLSHEMIHARRLDSLWGLLAQLALAVNWFNPLAWAAAKQFRKEQERSCDDAVVIAGTSAPVYAAHLVDLARSIAIPEPALGMAESFDLEGRVHALLDAGRARRGASRRLCVTMFGVALVLIVPLAAIHAQTGRASMTGLVLDPSGAVVPGATVSLKNIGGANEEVARGNEGGQYKLQGIPSGEYLLRVSVPGFATYQKTVTLADGAATTVNINLAVGEVREAITVVGTRSRPAMPSAAPLRIRVGGNVQPIKLISKVNPDYPADAQSEGVEGTVLLKAIVSKDGSLLSVKSISNGVDPRLVNAAKAAVPLWRYQPALLNGEPVEVITTIDVTFRLN
jgi:TonB family protein